MARIGAAALWGVYGLAVLFLAAIAAAVNADARFALVPLALSALVMAIALGRRGSRRVALVSLVAAVMSALLSAGLLLGSDSGFAPTNSALLVLSVAIAILSGWAWSGRIAPRRADPAP